jgi:hypothetical protein
MTSATDDRATIWDLRSTAGRPRRHPPRAGGADERLHPFDFHLERRASGLVSWYQRRSSTGAPAGRFLDEPLFHQALGVPYACRAHPHRAVGLRSTSLRMA